MGGLTGRTWDACALTHLVKTSNSKQEMKSLHVRSIVDLSAIASSGELIGCVSISVALKYPHGTIVL